MIAWLIATKWFVNYFISHVPSVIYFAVVHHTNMDRLSTSPTRRLIRYTSLVRLGSPRRVEWAAPLWEFWR